jgi:hypothetical protein
LSQRHRTFCVIPANAGSESGTGAGMTSIVQILNLINENDQISRSRQLRCDLEEILRQGKRPCARSLRLEQSAPTVVIHDPGGRAGEGAPRNGPCGAALEVECVEGGVPPTALFLPGCGLLLFRPEFQGLLSPSPFAVQFFFPFDPLVLSHDTSLEGSNQVTGLFPPRCR